MCLLSVGSATEDLHIQFAEYSSFKDNKRYRDVLDDLQMGERPFKFKAYWLVIKTCKGVDQWKAVLKKKATALASAGRAVAGPSE